LRQRHIGKTCPYCQFPIKQESEVVQCRACQVPHHRECWEENGGCTIFGCQETSFSTPAGRIEISASSGPENERAASRNGGINKLLAAALVMALLMIGLLGYNLLQDDDSEATDPSERAEPADSEGEADLAQRLEENYDSETIDIINEADYMIDYKHGTIPLYEVEIGARVVDPTWEWEFRTGPKYSREEGDEIKPVIWIVVAENHYTGLGPHVTLFSEELIGRFTFDNSTDRVGAMGYNHWGESGMSNATHGLRPWLNSTDLHSGEGFYRAFSESFKRAVLTTTLPNKEWQKGSAYSTSDHVFVPSTTELNDQDHNLTYPIGEVYAYYIGAGGEQRVSRIAGDAWDYWTRSPDSSNSDILNKVSSAGCITNSLPRRHYGVRPALNLKSEILVSVINH